MLHLITVLAFAFGAYPNAYVDSGQYADTTCGQAVCLYLSADAPDALTYISASDCPILRLGVELGTLAPEVLEGC